MQAGITHADRVVTVSPGYASEIQTYMGGWGMEEMLGDRQQVLNGITNGIDPVEWNPMSDPKIPHNYGIDDFVEGKRKNKMALQVRASVTVCFSHVVGYGRRLLLVEKPKVTESRRARSLSELGVHRAVRSASNAGQGRAGRKGQSRADES